MVDRADIFCDANSSELRPTSDLAHAFLESSKPALCAIATVFWYISQNLTFSRQKSADFHEIQHFGAFPNIFGAFLEQKVVTVTIFLNCWGCLLIKDQIMLLGCVFIIFGHFKYRTPLNSLFLSKIYTFPRIQHIWPCTTPQTRLGGLVGLPKVGCLG